MRPQDRSMTHNMIHTAEDQALAWLNELPFIEFEPGRSIVTELGYDNWTLWWLVHPILSRDLLLVIRRVLELLQEFGIRGNPDLGNSSQPWPLRLASDPMLERKLCGLVGTTETYSDLSKFSRTVYTFKALVFQDAFILYRNVFRPLRDFRRRLVGMKPSTSVWSDASQRRRVLVLTHTRTWGDVGWGEQGDIVLGPVIDELSRRGFSVVGVEADYSVQGELTSLRARLRYGPWMPFEAFFDRTISSKERLVLREKGKRWRILCRHPGFEALFCVERVSLFPVLAERLRQAFGFFAGEAVRYLEAARKIMKQLRPAVILLAYETGPIGRATIMAAQEIGIPTVAVQHGRIHPRHHLYVNNRVSWAGLRVDPWGCPIPDRTAVFGPETARVLTRVSSYPPKAVVVTGQPRTDRICVGLDRFDRRRVANRIGLDPGRPILLLATQNFPRQEDRHRVLEVAAAGAMRVPDVQVVIKPHPGEKDNFLERTLMKLGASKVIVRRDLDLYTALALCDVLATGTSTVGIEALMFGKPVIIVGGLPSPLPLASVGAALEANSDEEFARFLRELLSGGRILDQLRQAAQAYLADAFYKVDGRASERVVDVIEQLLEEEVDR